MTQQRPLQPYLDRAIADGHATVTGEGRTERINYVAANHSERFSDPEEKVRAEFWAELIYNYDYPVERIRFEVNVPRRTPNDFADLVIYSDDDLKTPYMVFECKRSDASDAAFNQSIEQACGNRASLGADFCGAVAGFTRRLLRFDRFPPAEREKNILPDIPIRYGNPPAWRFFKNTPGRELAAISREDLRAAIRKCHQTLWEGGKRSPIAAFGEFCKLVFIKHRDEKDLDREDGQPYAFQRKEGETAVELAARINLLYDAEKQKEPDVFTDNIAVDPPILAQCVEHLEGISLDRTDLDTKGVAFEEFMGGFFKGDFGQYFTPRELIAFAVEMMPPKRDELVLDPACGSGGFLLHALDHVRREADRRYPDNELQNFQYWHDFAQHNLYDIEVNDELTRVAKMNMIIHDDGHTNIVGQDALDFFENIGAKHPGVVKDKFDLVLTNPPFGATVKRVEKGSGYLEQFDLQRYISKNYPVDEDITGEGEGSGAKAGAKAVKERASVKTEVLFLERIHSFLKPGTGRAAVVLPDGILTNSLLQGVRRWLLAHFQLLAVVSLPQFAFSHYDAGVKASIIFLRRLAEGEVVSDDQPIFMALAENIGYDAIGRKTFAVTVEKEEAEERIEQHRCDLFDYRVYYTPLSASTGEENWSERRREIIPNTGLIGRYQAFQRDPTSFFRVGSVELTKPECFAVERGEITARADVRHHALREALVSPFPLQQLGALVVAEPEYGLSSRAVFRTSKVEPRFIRITDFGEDGIDVGHIFVTTEDAKPGYELASHDILFARSGSVGKTYIHEDDSEPAVFAGYCIRFRFNDATVSPRFVYWWSKTDAYLRWVAATQRPSVQANINKEEFKNCLIPLPPVDRQKELAAAMDAARAERKAKLAEAEAGWQEAKRWFEEQLLSTAKTDE